MAGLVNARPALTPIIERAGGAPRALPGEIDNGALLIVDVQGDFADPAVLAHLPEERRAAVTSAVDEILKLVDVARDTGLEVIWIRGRDATPPWASVLWLHNREGREEEGAGLCVPGTPGFDFWRVRPAPGELIVTKERYSGFVRTELESLLAERHVRWVAVCGLTTECCVASTAWDAIQRDLRVVVVGDAAAAYDEDLHTGALASMAENVGIVVSGADFSRALREAAAVPPALASNQSSKG